MVASDTYMRFWFPGVPAIVWVLIFSLLLLATNLLSVHSYGRFEFWFAMIKVAVLAALIPPRSPPRLRGRAPPPYPDPRGVLPPGAPAAPSTTTAPLVRF